MEPREELYTAALRSVGSIVMKLHNGKNEEQSQEFYQMSQMLDSLHALAPIKSREALGVSLDQLRTLHHGHLDREGDVNNTVDEDGASTAQPAAETSSEGLCLSVSALPVAVEATPEEAHIISGRPAVHVKPFINPERHHGVTQEGDVRLLQEIERPRGRLVYHHHAPRVECFLNHLDGRPRHLASECPEFMVTLNNAERSHVMDDKGRCHVCWESYGLQDTHPKPCLESSYCRTCHKYGHHDLLCPGVMEPEY